MRPPLMSSPAALAFVVIVASACPFNPLCDRSGCDATSSPANTPLEQGVAGAVSSSSDVVENGCARCPFSTATLGVYATDALATTEAEVDAAVAAGALEVLDVNGTYESELDAGAYIMCRHLEEGAPGPCVAFEVASGAVTTVNVPFVFGPLTFRVFDGAGDELEVTMFRTGP